MLTVNQILFAFSDDLTYQDDSSDSLEQGKSPINHNAKRQLGPRSFSSQSVPTTGLGLNPDAAITTLTIPVPSINDHNTTTTTTKSKPRTSSAKAKQEKYLSVPKEL